MKSSLLLILTIVLSCLSVTAQNWSLVMPNDTLVYEKQDNHQFFTVWVDSTSVNGTDTTYFMNRISPGEVIEQNDSLPICNLLNYFEFNSPIFKKSLFKPQFCGSKLVKYGSKLTVQFGQREFVVYPENPVGSSWISDSITFDTMSVISIDTAFIDLFQTIDSVKVLRFKGADIHLSKSHGLISSFDLRDSNQITFDNIGVQNLGIGTTIPMGVDFINFETGDTFFRRSGSGDSQMYIETLSQSTILSKSSLGDTLIYNVKINSQTTYYYAQSGGYDRWPIKYDTVTEKYWPTINPLFFAYPNTVIEIATDTFTNIFSFREINNRVLKGNIHPFYMDIPSELRTPQGICYHDSFLIQYPIFGPIETVVNNLGVTKYGFEFGLGNSEVELIGYKKMDGTSWGDTNPITGTREIEKSKLINIYPNPTKGFITIETEKLNGISILEMYNLQGQLITTQTFENELTLNVSRWNNGVYFAIIKDSDGAILHRDKVIIH